MNRAVTFAFPGRLDLNTGGYAYDRRLIDGLRALGFTVDLLALGEGFPSPDAKALAGAEARLSALPKDSLLLIDGLAFGVLDAWAEREAMRLRIVALVHHPLALETGLSERARARLWQSETRALTATRHVVVTSPMTARTLAEDYGVAPEAITVALPGTDPAPIATSGNRPPHIVSIGTLTRRKGHDILLAALKRIETLDWRATIVGSRDLDPATAGSLLAQAAELGLLQRVVFTGECPDTRTILATGDVFALASRYEGYGMVFAEALSQGLPIVACAAGAVSEVVPETAGILVPVDETQAFAAALARLLTDPAERQARAAAALKAGRALPGWPETARRVAAVLENVT